MLDSIKEYVESSQHCQRNWDLSKKISQEHLDLFTYILQTVPSKQNVAYYKAHFIFNNDLKRKIYDNTATYSARFVDFCNPQVLANLLIVFEDYLDFDPNRNINDDLSVLNNTRLKEDQKQSVNNIIHEDRQQAIGIASGQLILVANMLGYKTGFCKCFNNEEIKKLLNTSNRISLLLGVGFPNEGVPHNVHELVRDDSTRPRKKFPIPITIIE